MCPCCEDGVSWSCSCFTGQVGATSIQTCVQTTQPVHLQWAVKISNWSCHCLHWGVWTVFAGQVCLVPGHHWVTDFLWSSSVHWVQPRLHGLVCDFSNCMSELCPFVHPPPIRIRRVAYTCTGPLCLFPALHHNGWHDICDSDQGPKEHRCRAKGGDFQLQNQFPKERPWCRHGT